MSLLLFFLVLLTAIYSTVYLVIVCGNALFDPGSVPTRNDILAIVCFVLSWIYITLTCK
jgi:hypothetical protein